MGLLDDAIKEHLELKRRRGADAGEISRLESEALGPVRRSADGVPDLSDTFVAPEEPAGEAVEAAPAPPEDEHTALHGALPEPPAYEPPPPPPAYAPPPVVPAREPPPPAVPPKPLYGSPPVTPPPIREAWKTAPEPEPEAVPGPQAAAEPEPEPEPSGLLARLRVGRRHKAEPEPGPEPARPAAFEPPPVPATPAYEPPPPPSPSYEPPPPPVQHEPDIVPADDEPDGEELLEETPEFLEETPEHDRLWFEQRPPRDFDFDG
jgi:hypothetical protein